MLRKSIWVSIILLILCSSFGAGAKMRRTIQGVGDWYYKILMTLGTCKEKVLFSEQQIWGRVRMNRIFDIYYESDDGNKIIYGIKNVFKVSRVEIKLIINESDVMAYSAEGVGHAKFTATVYLPINTFVIFYSLKIFTCSVSVHPNEYSAEGSEGGFQK